MKKYLLTFSLLLSLITSPLSATTLWDFYNGNLPSISARGEIYKDIGDDKYTGTATQNINLLSYLLGDKPFPNDPSFTDQSIVFGATLPSGTPLFETALQSQITTSATTMTLTANATSGGGSLSGYNCFTIDEGSAQAEYVCGTVSGTSVTSLLRGVDPMTATTTNASLQFAHRRGANVKITDFPLIQIMKHQLNGEDTFQNILYYSRNNTFSSSTQLVSKSYVDGVAISGAPNADTSTKGIVEIATGLETASSTPTGSTGAITVIPSSLGTSTPGTTTGLNVVVAQNNGKIHQGFLDLSQNFNFSGAINASSSQNFVASTTAFTINAGVVNATSSLTVAGRVVGARYVGITTGAFGLTNVGTTTTVSVPGGAMQASSTIDVYGTASCSNGNCIVKVVNQNGTPFVTCSTIVAGSGNGLNETFHVQIYSNTTILTSQVSACNGTQVQNSGTIASSNQGFDQGAGTSSFNLASAFSVSIVGTESTNDLTLYNTSIVVNP